MAPYWRHSVAGHRPHESRRGEDHVRALRRGAKDQVAAVVPRAIHFAEKVTGCLVDCCRYHAEGALPPAGCHPAGLKRLYPMARKGDGRLGRWRRRSASGAGAGAGFASYYSLSVLEYHLTAPAATPAVPESRGAGGEALLPAARAADLARGAASPNLTRPLDLPGGQGSWPQRGGS